MREALKNAVHNAILLEYKLPHKVSGLDLDKSCLSSQNDICFSNSNPQEISKIIYNGIKKCIDHIASEYTRLNIVIPASFDYRLFFIFLPLSEVKQIKENVIKWIDSHEPLI